MARVLLVFLGLLIVGAAGLQAQTVPPTQSLRPTPSACSAGSQSVRVCNNDFTSCNDVCAARALNPSSEIVGCTTACCYNFNVCLRMRGCGPRAIDCD